MNQNSKQSTKKKAAPKSSTVVRQPELPRSMDLEELPDVELTLATGGTVPRDPAWGFMA